MPTHRRILGALAALIVAAGVTTPPAWADADVTITFVRHAESAGNAGGIIDTTVPGPPLTAKGEVQAKDAAVALAAAPHDGVYASTMIRTQQTAQPYADDVGRQIVVLPGLREIEAGDLEGRPEEDALAGTSSRCDSGWTANGRPASRGRSTATSSTPGSTTPSTPSTAAATGTPSRSPTVGRSRSGRC